MFGSGLAQLLVAALYIVTARSMRPDEYGPIVTAIAIGLAGSTFMDLGCNAYWVREIAGQRMSLRELNVRVSVRLIVVLAIGALAVAVAAVMAPAYVGAGFLLITASTAQTALVPLRASQRSESVAWLMVLGRGVSVAAFFGETAFGFTPGQALWTSLAVGDLALATCAFVITPAANRPSFRFRPMRNPWSGAKWYAVSVMSTSAAQLDLPIVAALAGPAAAGIYGGVNRWTQPVLIATGAFAQATAPFIAAEPRIMALRGQFFRASWILIAAILLSVAVFMTAPWLVTSLLGADFRDSAPVLRLLALATLLNTVTQPLTVALQSRRLDHVAAILVVSTAATQLIVTSVLAPRFGALAAGIGMLAAQILAFVGTVGCIVVIARKRANRAQ